MEKEKKGLTYLLTITSNGGKLPPYVIFQGKKDSTLNKELNNCSESNKFNIIVRTQHNAWIDEE